MGPRFTKRPRRLRVLAITGLTALVATVVLGAAAPAYGDELLPTEPTTEVVEPAPAPEPVVEEPPAEPVVEPPAEPVEPPAEPPAEEPVVEPPVDEPTDEPADDPSDEPDDSKQDAAAPEAPALTADIGVLNISGAIFTTNSACNGVNVNIFDAKSEVYLDGGPQGPNGPALPDGTYFVKVTEPNGDLLGIVGSGLQVSGGSFVTCYNLFALTGFGDSPNGEYKVWISMDSSFPNNQSKTDNFRVRSSPDDLIPTVLTQVIDNRSGSDITNQTISLPAGESFTVHDVATVTGESGEPAPTGSVTFQFFNNGVCNPEGGGQISTEDVGLVGDTASSSDSASLPIDPSVIEYSYQASYSGDTNYLSSFADCEPFFLTIVESNVTPVPPAVEGASAETVVTAQLAFTGGGRTWMIPLGILLVFGGLALFVFYGRRERQSGLGV